MKNLIKQKKVEGNVFAIPLDGIGFIYGLVCKGGDMCFFRYITSQPIIPDDLQKAEILFRACVNDSAPKEGNWIYVGNTNLIGDQDKYSFYVNKPVGSDEVYEYSIENDTFTLSSQRATEGLEAFGSWFAKNINDRIVDLLSESKHRDRHLTVDASKR